MSTDQSVRRAQEAALRLLSYRPRSEAELRTRLNRRFPSGTVDQVLHSLKQRSLVDDRAFARLWAQSRDRQKPRSAAAIRRELVAKGVTPETAANAASTVDDEESAIRAAAQFARRLADADSTSFRRRLYGFLQRRGYGSGVIRRTVSRLWEEKSHGSALSAQADAE